MHLCDQGIKLPASLPSVGLVGQVVSSLCQANARGAVVIRFERCAYLQFNKQLVCFGLFELGASSITAVFDQMVHTLPQCFIVGAAAQLSSEYLLIDDQYFFDLRGSSLYISKLEDSVLKFKVPTTQFELLAKLAIPSAGFAPLLRRFTAANSEAELTSVTDANSIESELLRFSMPAIEQLTDQLRGYVSGRAVKPACFQFNLNLIQKLIGAGPGLTPSGDDFLCGVFTALHLAEFPDVAKSLWTSISSIAERSTTPVSFALLERSALGESGERIDDVIKAYYDYPTTTAAEFRHRVELIGETSGWDWLTGFVLCSEILRRSKNKMPASFGMN